MSQKKVISDLFTDGYTDPFYYYILEMHKIWHVTTKNCTRLKRVSLL